MLTVDARRRASRPRVKENSSLDELVFYISRAFYAYVTRLETVLNDLGLNEHVQPGMGHVLFALFERDDVIIKDLVARTRLAPSSLGRLLAQMERNGLLKRTRCQNDGRAVRIHLTPLGKSLESKCREALRRLKQTVERGFEPDELLAVRRGVERVIENLRSGV